MGFRYRFGQYWALGGGTGLTYEFFRGDWDNADERWLAWISDVELAVSRRWSRYAISFTSRIGVGMGWTRSGSQRTWGFHEYPLIHALFDLSQGISVDRARRYMVVLGSSVRLLVFPLLMPNVQIRLGLLIHFR